MTDGQSLLLLFVALYLMECLRWLPARAYLIIGSRVRWRIQRPFQPIELAASCPTLLSFLPPLQTHFFTLPWQLIPAAEGLELHVDERQPYLLPWTEVKPEAQGRYVKLSHNQRVRCLSENHARAALKLVQTWSAMSEDERAKDFLSYAEQTLRTEPVQSLATHLANQTQLLRQLGNLIFVWTFILMVALYRWLGESVVVLWAAAGLLLLQLTQAFFFYRRSQGVSYRFWKALAMALLPQHAIRAADHLADVSGSVASHPLAARTLLTEEVWKQQARQFWKKARYRPSATANVQSRALGLFLEKEGVPLSELESAPAQQADSASYCPNCQAQFQISSGLCQDCGGVTLKPF